MPWPIFVWLAGVIGWYLYLAYKHGCLQAIIDHENLHRGHYGCRTSKHVDAQEAQWKIIAPVPILGGMIWPLIPVLALLWLVVIGPFKLVSLCGKKWGCNIKL